MYGVNDQRRVPCTNSPHHGFRPANEVCKYCAPEEDVQPEMPQWERDLYNMYESVGWSTCGVTRRIDQVRSSSVCEYVVFSGIDAIFSYERMRQFEGKHAEKLKP